MTSDPAPVEPLSVTRFREELARRGGTGRVVVLPDTVHTAALAAAALGCEVGAIANSLLFDADGRPLLILTSGAHRVDTAKVAALLGVPELTKATAAFVREHTGQAIGGVGGDDQAELEVFAVVEGVVEGGASVVIAHRPGVRVDRDRVGVEDGFLDLGGHSLLATQITARVTAAFGERIAASELLQAPTVAQMALVMLRALASEMEPSQLQRALGGAGDAAGR